MRIGRNAGIATMAGAIVIVGATGIATASAGHPLLLGHVNKAGATTVLKSSYGAALSLKSPSGSPALSVSNSRQISHLNANFLNGLTASQIEAAAKAGQTQSSGGITEVVAQLTGGVGVAVCPAGTAPIGGGVLPDPTGTSADDIPFLVASTPHLTNGQLDGWEGIASDFDGTYNGGGVVFASCGSSVTQPANRTAISTTEHNAAAKARAR